jgi:hypothetical protein
VCHLLSVSIDTSIIVRRMRIAVLIIEIIHFLNANRRESVDFIRRLQYILLFAEHFAHLFFLSHLRETFVRRQHLIIVIEIDQTIRNIHLIRFKDLYGMRLADWLVSDRDALTSLSIVSISMSFFVSNVERIDGYGLRML